MFENRRYLIQNIIRISLVFCIFFYFPSSAANLFRSVYKTFSEKKYFSSSAADEGLGGKDYSEKELEQMIGPNSALNDDFVEGIPEPEEFSMPRTLVYSSYKVQSGDMIGFISSNFGLNQDTLISVNNISNTRSIQVGKKLLIPNQDGIMHMILPGETLDKIADKYEVNADSIVTANELFSEKINAGFNIFIPNAKLDSAKLQEINGDLFIWPVRGRLTSGYGYRRNPISGLRGFHSGIDLSANTGVPIKAAMAGRIISTGYNDVFGNFVVISHHSNYRTLYGHMSVIRVETGAYVRSGQTIGDVGNTGQSTGSHLHFQVYKNGLTVNPLLLMH
ncbi:MAG: M23 family metallopeptidase [Spirochaetaceae bacterium]|jgi:murein DD-endopeptidase MepM/ murein hydrolase activator NlpD|nr:M23 family metallopeptidase [Spirochaetaceae bacterium]